MSDRRSGKDEMTTHSRKGPCVVLWGGKRSARRECYAPGVRGCRNEPSQMHGGTKMLSEREDSRSPNYKLFAVGQGGDLGNVNKKSRATPDAGRRLKERDVAGCLCSQALYPAACNREQAVPFVEYQDRSMSGGTFHRLAATRSIIALASLKPTSMGSPNLASSLACL